MKKFSIINSQYSNNNQIINIQSLLLDYWLLDICNVGRFADENYLLYDGNKHGGN